MEMTVNRIVGVVLIVLAVLGLFVWLFGSGWYGLLMFPFAAVMVLGGVLLWLANGSASEQAPVEVQAQGNDEELSALQAEVVTLKQQLAANADQAAATGNEWQARATEAEGALQASQQDLQAQTDRVAQLEADLAAASSAAAEAQASASAAVAAAPAATAGADRAEFAGKDQSELNRMFGGQFVDGTMARHFQIDYTDSKGQESQREIVVYALVNRKGNLNMDSFPTDGYSCLTFRADRVRKLKDLQSGEEVSENITEFLLNGAQL